MTSDTVTLTTAQAAELVDRPTVTVRQWCRKGWLKAEKVGRDWLINPKDLERFTPRKPGRPAAAARPPAPAPDAEPNGTRATATKARRKEKAK